ncbi:MAG: hypothetical protein BWY60_00402 [Actinobacteria bacterium ADurb.Bin346]|nr:MAG: hypothetical protein BWY60_00402 [Actinobacteria bacterium ADurb.Bin346]
MIADKLDFTVIKGELVTFEHGITYSNDDYGFTISIPDNWTFKENPSDNAIMIELIPEKYIITRFAFIAAPSKPVKPYDKFAEEDAAGFAEENSWTQVSSQSRDYSLANGDPVKQIMYLHQDGQKNQYATAYTFIEHGDNVYILYAAADKESAGEVTEAAYFGILQSLALR